MYVIEKLKFLSPRAIQRETSKENLERKSTFLAASIVELKREDPNLAEKCKLIETTLQDIKNISGERGKWNQYQTAYLLYLRIAPVPELLGAFIGARMRDYRLDQGSRVYWEKNKLDSIEKAIRTGTPSLDVRELVVTLQRSLDDCGFRHTRDQDLKSSLISIASLWSLVLFLGVFGFWAALEACGILGTYDVPRVVLATLFGGVGGLISATMLIRGEKFRFSELKMKKSELVFRPVLGSISALILVFLIEAGFVDFPFLRLTQVAGSHFSPYGLNVIGFVSGFSERFLIRALSGISGKREKK